MSKMSVMHICGLSMEMEAAEELGLIGKCKGCIYYETRGNLSRFMYCDKKKKVLDGEVEDCPDWVVGHR